MGREVASRWVVKVKGGVGVGVGVGVVIANRAADLWGARRG